MERERGVNMDFDILDYIPFGIECAISRHDLRQITGLNDREMRKMIRLARERAPILNLQQGNGYFRPTPDEMNLVDKWMSQEKRRAKSVFRGVRAAKKFLNGVG